MVCDKERKRFNISLLVFCSLVLFILSVAKVQAVTNTALGTGNWETTTNWDQGHAPTNSEDVVIPSNITVTINSAAVCASLTIGSGSN